MVRLPRELCLVPLARHSAVVHAAGALLAQPGSAAWRLPAAWGLRAVDRWAPVFPALSPSPEAAWQAQPVVSAQPVPVRLRAEPPVQDGAAAVLPARSGAAVALRPEAVAAQDGVPALQREAAARDAVAVRPEEAAALAWAGLLRAVPGAAVAPERPSVVAWALPWVWVFRRDQAPPWPAP